MHFNTTGNITIGYPPTKKDIIQRLFQEGHIDFNEMWILLQDEPTIKYVPMPQQQFPAPVDPWTPTQPWNQPFTYTVDPANAHYNSKLHNPPRGTSSSE